jgi:short-subunit dehydrogenase involved in D-alanine esterification of teichoic acids
MTDKILVTGGSSIGKALAKVVREQGNDLEIAEDIVLCAYESIKYSQKVMVDSDNQSFIQQKMQGKRRIY